MEPRKSDKPLEIGREGQTSPPRQPEKKRRFKIVKLEERIAPSKGGKTHGHRSGIVGTCGCAG
jgi:hypothetical protein